MTWLGILGGTPAAAQSINVNEYYDYQAGEILQSFCNALEEAFPNGVGNQVFVPLFKTMFKGVELKSYEKLEGDRYKLTLNGRYEVAVDEGKKYFYEKELLMQFERENYRILFPEVLEMREKKLPLDVEKKGLKAFWGVERVAGSDYTGVGHTIRWDDQTKELINENINDMSDWNPLKNIKSCSRKPLQEALKPFAAGTKTLI